MALWLALMLALILSGAGLGAVIAASGGMPLLSGLLSLVVVRRAHLPFRLRPGAGRVHAIVPTAGWLLVVELSNLVSYAFQRVILGAFRSPGQVGLYEGPLRAHNLLYALGGALAVPTVPTASRYVAAGDDRRLRELVLRGSRYTLALFVPVCVTLMALAEPLLRAWLGDRYGEGATALTILVSYWLLYGALVVTPGFLVGAGRAREVALVMSAAAALNVGLSLVLTPELGLEGPALATAVAFVLAFPFLLRLGLRAGGRRPRGAGPRGLAARVLAGRRAGRRAGGGAAGGRAHRAAGGHGGRAAGRGRLLARLLRLVARRRGARARPGALPAGVMSPGAAPGPRVYCLLGREVVSCWVPVVFVALPSRPALGLGSEVQVSTA